MPKSTDILNKKQNYALWQSGAFGNKLRAWRTVEEWRASEYPGLVVLRVLFASGGGPCQYKLSPAYLALEFSAWRLRGVSGDHIMINEMAPDDSIVLQGEYLNDICAIEPCWGYFLHSRVQQPMRTALACESRISLGLQSDLLIREAMTPSSYDDWQMLLERYPGHVFEVSIYDRCLGDIPNRNALVWEIRKY